MFRPSRLIPPLLWMVLGGTAVFLWNPRGPKPPAHEPVTVSRLTLAKRGEGWSCDNPDALPRAAVLRVVDGDTIEILWNDAPTFLRYYGVNTPERDQPCYDEATRRNRELAGASVRLAFDERQRDVYHRLLAYVFTETGESIDGRLVTEGFGRSWKRDGAFRDALQEMERDARDARRGCLWSGETSPAPKRKKRRTRTRG